MLDLEKISAQADLLIDKITKEDFEKWMIQDDGMNERTYIREQLAIELERSDKARKRRHKLARQSFMDWMCDMVILPVGRSLGYHLKIAKSKFGKLWDWLFA